MKTYSRNPSRFHHLFAPPARLFGLLLSLCLSVACARIEPEVCPTLTSFDQLAATPDSAAARSPVFISAEYLVKKKHDAKLTASLEASIEERLRAQGFETTDDESKSASKIACTVSTWQGYGHNTDSIAILTLGMYTPFHYPWTIETDFTDRVGGKAGTIREKGKFFIFSIGTIFLHIPTAIVFTTAVPAKRRELADNAAKMVVVLLSDKSAITQVEAAQVDLN